ncbi:MAG: nucleotide pyrophosphohydrolase [Ruminococcaceae bacterium]|nr:nucleotide pyrophosphohydrolase [Oscillospiraceae bacterium]
MMKISIDDLQAYLTAHYSGRTTEQSMFMKLVEEIGEVAEVLNKRAGRKATNETDLQEQLGTELADMIHYIVAIAALNDIDLSRIILEKDKKAAVKYNHTMNLEQFLTNKE